MRRLTRVLHVLWALSLAAVVVLPALPRSVGGRPAATLGGWLRKISIKQHWGMYAPDPQRSQAYLDLTAELADGSEVELEETLVEREGWTTRWAWHKTRMDIWRHYAGFRAKGGNPNRTWYVRGACVREARRRGEPPRRIVVTQVRRRFATPAAVRDGAPGLGPAKRKRLHVQRCDQPGVLRQIQADQHGRGDG